MDRYAFVSINIVLYTWNNFYSNFSILYLTSLLNMSHITSLKLAHTNNSTLHVQYICIHIQVYIHVYKCSIFLTSIYV